MSLIGKGGMGSVWLGQHIVIGKRVAIKILKAELAENDDVVKRFYREAQATAAIAHSNIIDVMDVGVSPSGEPYLVMEYLEGESLDAMLKRTGPIDLPAALAVLEPALLALAATHDRGIIHRDLKPENIFIAHAQGESPKVKLIDFGISKFTQKTGASKLTQTGLFLGTPSYMSPEQIRGDSELDHRADLYAIGVILYEMLTGALPFKGDHCNALLINVLTEYPIPPGEAYPDFPSEAEPLLMRLLSKSPDGRPGSARELIDEIKQLASYDKREEHLSRYTTSIPEKRCAAGDLGDTAGVDSKGAAEILAEMSTKPTPADWARTLTPSRRSVSMLAIVLAVVAAAMAIILLVPGARAPKTSVVPLAPVSPTVAPSPPALVTAPQSSAPTPSVQLKSIQIKVMGVLAGATIFYNEERMPSDTFKTEPSGKEMLLRVSAPGYADFVKRVVPDRDMAIEAHLVPLATEEAPADRSARMPERQRASKKQKRAESEPPSAKPTPEAALAEERPSKKLVKGGRGTMFSTSFDD